ncbi:MAG TPA: hypothetical protein VFS00_03530 [Polyangiaceae bacterium]|nr:hypothetical protein [Polyangiaceae bacterium]
MTIDFKAALQKGMAAHDGAAQAEREIDEVLAELSRQLTEVMGVKISVTQGSESRDPLYPAAFFTAAARKTASYAALIARVPRGSRATLCEFEPARSGYPVSVAFGDEQYHCFDRPSLEETLARMLQDPVVAGQIKALVAPVPGRPPPQGAEGREGGEGTEEE